MNLVSTLTGWHFARLGLVVAVMVSAAFAQSVVVLPAGTVGVPYSFQVTTTPPAAAGSVYSASGLPEGFTINASSGLIAGTPTTAGTYAGSITIAASSVNTYNYTLAVQTPTWLINPVGGPTGGGTFGVSGNQTATQFLGARISLATNARVVAVQGEFATGSGTLFAAVVRLSSVTSLPAGDGGGGPFGIGEVIASRTFTMPGPIVNPVIVPLEFDATPGVYGVVFGSGQFGATGSAGMTPNITTTGSSSFSWVVPPSIGPHWQNLTSSHFKIGLATATPPPSGVLPVFTLMPSGREVVNAGQNITLTATASNAASYQWKRNGRPIIGATTASYVLTNAQPAKDSGWYQVVATNSTGSTTSPTFFLNVAVSPGEVVPWGASVYGSIPPPSGLNNIAGLAAGGAHAAALRGDGTVLAWGLNSSNQTTVPSGLTNVVRLVAGGYHNLALGFDGRITAWGMNDHGECTVPGGLNNVVDVAGGSFFSVALKSDGTVVAWGQNTAGVGETVVPSGLNQVVGIAAGQQHTLALKSDGTVVGWGDNFYGQATPPSGLNNVIAVVAGALHSLALKADGTVVAWGNSADGRATVPAGLANVVAIGAGEQHSVALKADGTVVVWGADGNGVRTQATNLQGGLLMATSSYFGFIARTPLPAPVFTAISNPRQVVNAGQNLSLSATATGATSYQWKRNGRAIAGATSASFAISGAVHARDAGWYQLLATNAVGTTASAVIFVNVAVDPGQVVAWGSNSSGQVVVPSTLTGAVAIAAGEQHTLALKPDGTVVAWGTTTNQATVVPGTLANVVAIAAGHDHSLALKSDGTVVAWGYDGYGEVTLPAGLANVVAVSAAAFHNLALKADGTVVAWGSNAFGESTVPAGLNNVAAISAGLYHCLALKADGSIVAWGSNTDGNTTIPAGLTNVVGIASRWQHSMALKADGTVVAWGFNGYGQTTVPAGLANVVLLAAGQQHSLALKSDGSVVGWGLNGDGEITPPAGLTGVAALAAGGFHSVALRALVTAAAPIVTTQPGNAAAAVTGSTTFSVTVTGTPAPLLRWQRQPSGTTGFADVVDDSTFSGATTATLSVTAPAAAMNGDQFRCVASNGAGTTFSNVATLTVFIPPAITSPSAATFVVGNPGTFTVTATGSPTPTFTITAGTVPSWATFNTTTGLLSGTPPNATGSPFSFTIRAANDYQSATQNFTLTVQTSSDGPTITIQPTNASVAVGGNVTFTAAAVGNPTPSLQWQRSTNGGTVFANLTNGGSYFGVTTATLTVSGAAQAMDGDQFRIVATNVSGAATSTAAALAVSTAGIIATQPVSRNVTVGQPATFNVVANGSGPVLYQWRRNGVAITGATNASYTIGVAQRNDADVYDVEVTINALRATSNPVRLLVAPSSYPGAVAPDPAFNVALEAGGAVVYAFASLPDGKVMAAGDFIRFNGHPTCNVARLTAAGAIDPTFAAPPCNAAFYAIARQTDGKLLVAGYFTQIGGLERTGVARLNADGSLDSAFRLLGPGNVPHNIFGPSAIAIQPDGRFIVAGLGPVERFNADGTLDPSFVCPLNGNGIVNGTRLALAADGHIWVGGMLSSGTSFSYLARLNPDGALDTSFNGTLLSAPPQALVASGEGKLYVGGYFNSIVSGQPATGLLRLNPDGSRDTTYALAAVPGLTDLGVDALALQPNGELWAAGGGQIARLAVTGAVNGLLSAEGTTNTTTGRIVTLLPNADGSLWAGGAFSRVGFVVTETVGRFPAGATFGTPAAAVGQAVNTRGSVQTILPETEGRILIGGLFRSVNGAPAANVARLTAAGALDPTFLVGEGASAQVNRLVRLPDGKVLAIGYFSTFNRFTRFGCARLFADGTLDQSFTPPANASIYEAVPVRDGKLLLNGFFFENSETRYLMRVLPDGRPDPTFVAGGPNENVFLHHAFAQPDGRLVVVGAFNDFAGTTQRRIMRLLPDGAIDTSFNTGTGFDPDQPPNGNGIDVAQLTPTNRIMVAGIFTTFNGANVSGLVRLNQNGSLDTSFVAPVRSQLPGYVNGLMMQEDDKTLAWATGYNVAGALPVLFRLNSNGSVDTSFRAYGLGASDSVTTVVMGDAGQLYYALWGSGRVTRMTAAAAPVIGTPLVPQVVAAGGTATFSATVTAAPAATYQWFKNGTALSGATNATLTLNNVTGSDAGTYSFTASNDVGTATATGASLTVSANGFSISVQPQDALVTSGEPASFSVGVTSTTTVTYQWRRNGFNLAGATGAAFTIPAARRFDADYYDVVVTGGTTSLTSSPAALRVAPTSYPGVVAPDPAWYLQPENDNGSVNVLLRLVDGRTYVGGAFLRAGGQRRTSVMRLTASGAVDATFVPPEIDNTVSALAVQPDGRLIIAGAFSRVDGVLRPRLARLHADGHVDAGFNSGGSGPASTPTAVAALPDGNIVIGGVSSFNGTSVNRLAWLDASGALLADARNDPPVGSVAPVNVIAPLSGGRIAVGGNVTTSGLVAGGFSVLRSDGTPDPSFNVGVGANAGGGVMAIAVQPDGKLVIGGTFTSFGGQTRNRIARLDATGALDTTFDSGAGFTNTVRSLALQSNGRIIAAGSTTASSGSNSDLARLLPSGARDPSFTAPLPSTNVVAVAVQTDDRVLLGGSFTTLDSTARDGIARLESTGAFDTGFNLDLRGSASIGAMALLPGGQVLLARSFAYLRGEAVPARVTRFNADGTRDATFNPGGVGADNIVYGLVRMPDGKIVIAGSFANYNGTSVGRIARLNASGALDTGYNPSGSGFDNSVNSLVHVGGGAIVAGGVFSSFNGTARNYLARIDAQGALVSSFAPTLNGSVDAVAAYRDGRILVAGGFSAISGITANRVARLLDTGAVDTTFNAGAGHNGSTTALAVLPDGRLLVAGTFTTFAGVSRPTLARLNSDGSLDGSFAPDVRGGTVYSLHVQEDGRIIVRGTFTSVAGRSSTAFLARLNADGTPDAAFAAGGIASSGITNTRMMMADDGRLLLPAGTSVGLQVTRPAAAPQISSQPVAATVLTGGTATFTVGATSGASATYQWFRNGAPLPGANDATLVLNGVTAAQTGSYTVSITSELGGVTSTPAALALFEPPRILSQPAHRAVGVGGLSSFQVVASTTGGVTYQWRHDGAVIPAATNSVFTIGAVGAADAGLYAVEVVDAVGTIASTPARLTILPNPLSYSAWQFVDAGGAWAFFAIDGTQPKRVLLRALGPAVAGLGLTGTLADPAITVFDAEGRTVAFNDAWSDGGASLLAATFATVGALPLVAGSADAAVLISLPAGSYAVRVGNGAAAASGSGAAFVELFDTDLNPQSRLSYVSLRGRVDGSPYSLAAGLLVTNSAQKKLLIRAVPSAARGLAVADPRLEVYDAGTLFAQNDNWGGGANLMAAGTAAGAFALAPGSNDAAVLIEQRVGSGTYTAQVPLNGPAGDALLEFYDVPGAVSSNFAPLVVRSPRNLTVTPGGNTTLTADTVGTPPLAYQWRKNGDAIAGATTSTLALLDAQNVDAGSYDVIVTNTLGTALSRPAVVAVGMSAAHAVVDNGYVAGRTVTITNVLSFTGPAASLGWEVNLPEGWTFASTAGDTGETKPRAGDSGHLGWAWTNVPASPVVFTYTLNVPATEAVPRTLTGAANVRADPNVLTNLVAGPDPLTIAPAPYHAADTDRDFRIGLLELTRVIELYNTRHGSSRTGAYVVAATASEDGFVADAARDNSAAALARYHSADTQGDTIGSPRDGRINLLELTRVIQLYNQRNGATRTGTYHVQAGTEDGFAPGP